MATEQTRRQLRARLRWGIAGIVALFFIALAYDMPAKANKVIDRVNGMVALGIPHISVADFSLGLDLQGGAHLVYQADVTAIPDGDRATAVEGVRDVIERRVNGIGVGEPHVQTTKVGDEYRVIVELPGVTDINRAISMIGGTPILEFKEENDVPARDLTKDEQKQINDFNADAKKRADETLKRLKNGEVFSDIAKEVSEDPYSKNNGGYIGYISNTFDPTLYNWAQTAAQGDQSHVIENEAGYALLERAGERAGEPSIEASDIVICYLGSSDCDAPLYTKKEAKDKAQEIFDQANASNFDDLALQYSTSQKRTDSPEAMDALKKASAGEIIGPVEAGDGFHVLYKQSEQPTVEYEISLIFIKKQTILDILPPQDPWKPTGLSGKNLERAEVVSDTISGAVQVSLQFD